MLFLAIGVYIATRGLVISTSVSPSRDGERYFTYAQRLQHEKLVDVARDSVDHPGYPLALATAQGLASAVGVSFDGETGRRDRVTVAQMTTAFCGLVFLLGAYGLVASLWGRAYAGAVTVALAFLPRPLWQTCDILSDPLYAALVTWSAAFFVIALRMLEDRRYVAGALLFALSGGALSDAYWARVDAVIPFCACVLTLTYLAALQLHRRIPLLASTSTFFLFFAFGLIGFYLVRGELSGKPVVETMIFGAEFRLASSQGPLLAQVPLAVARGIGGAFVESVSVLGKEVQYAALVLAAVGVVRAVRRPRTPVGVFAALLILGVLAAVVLLDLRRSGLGVRPAARYFLVIAPVVLALAMDGAAVLLDLVRRGRNASPASAALVMLLAVVCSSAPSLFGRRLHDTYHGEVAGMAWVAEQMEPRDTVYSTGYFSAYFAGVTAARSKAAVPTKGKAAGDRHYAVVPQSYVARLPALEKAIAAGRAVSVATFPRRPHDEEKNVHVYRLEW